MNSTLKWVRFVDRMPRESESNHSKCVIAVDVHRNCRAVLFNWVMSPDLWTANGFVAWAPLPRSHPASAGDDLDAETGESLRAQEGPKP